VLKYSCVYGLVLISPLPDLIPDVVGRNRCCRWKEGSVHVANCKSFLVTEAERSMLGDARDFNNIETRAVIRSPPPLQGRAQKEIHAILTETLGEHAPSYATVRNWVAQFKSTSPSVHQKAGGHPIAGKSEKPCWVDWLVCEQRDRLWPDVSTATT